MQVTDERNLETIPVGPLGIIPLESCKELGDKVNSYLVAWRNEREHEHKSNIAFKGYQRDSYIIGTATPRFGSGEAKGVIKESVRGDDLYIMVDVCNYNMTYSLYGYTNHMSPDDHFQDLKRIIGALALQELVDMGVDNIITFDAHDPRVQNAIPLKGFETVQPVYQFIKGLFKAVPDLHIDKDTMMIISPDEGGMGRAIYMSNVLSVDMGMFYKRRDYARIVNGKNPIVAHEFLGADVEGKDHHRRYDLLWRQHDRGCHRAEKEKSRPHLHLCYFWSFHRRYGQVRQGL